jgi:ATP-binding cassette subfamily B protein
MPRDRNPRDLRRSLALLVGTAFRADVRRAVGVLTVSTVESVARISFAYWLKLFTVGVVRDDLTVAAISAGAYGACLAIVGVTNLLRVNWTTVLREKTALLLDEQLIELSAGLPGIEHHENPEYIDRIELIREERGQLGASVWALVGNLQAFVMLATSVVLLATLDPVLILLPLFAIPSLIVNRRTARLIESAVDASAESLRLSRHLFRIGVSAQVGKELRIFGLNDEIGRRHHAALRDYDVARTRGERASTVLRVAGLVFFGIGYSLALVLVAAHGAASSTADGVSDLVLAFTLAAQVNRLMSTTAANVLSLSLALTCFSRLLWLIDYSATRRAHAGELAVPARLERGITFEDLTFCYPGGESPTLTGVTVTIPAGSTVAIVGENGAGKTTLVKLLCRMYEPSSGRILLDGVDIASFDVEAWRRRLAGAFQDFVRFSFQAGQTVGVGDPDHVDDDAAVWNALHRVQAADVVADLPHGLRTQLGTSFTDGVELSGGQWQKLALGRANMRTEPLLLFLDEPTASLDAQSEHEIFQKQARTAQAAAARTGAVTFLVSHRFSTTRMADLIMVLHDSGIAELGSHDELVAAGGIYAELYELQASAYR